MTKRKFELKVKREVEALQSEGDTAFVLNIIHIEPVIECDNDAEALVQINYQNKQSVKASTVTLLYYKKASKKEEHLNTNIILENKSVYKLIKEFKKNLSDDVVKNTEFPEVVDTTIAKSLLAIYKQQKKEYSI